MQFGLPYVVKRKVRPYDTATLNYNWQVWNTEAFSLYTTATEQIDPNGAGQAVLAVMNFLSAQSIIPLPGTGSYRIKGYNGYRACICPYIRIRSL